MKSISFTKDIKENICQNNIDYSVDLIIPLLSSFIRTNGTLIFRNNSEYLYLEIENAQVIRFIYSKLKELMPDLFIHFSYRKSMKFNKGTKFIIEIKDPFDLLKALNIDFLESKIALVLTNKESKIKSYLAGLFLACGSCNDPKSSNYHLEFSLKDFEFAKAILKLINKIKTITFNFKYIQRRNAHVLYLKRSDQISDFLGFIEANNSCLYFENVRIGRDFSNITNRLVNCDTYNFNKTIENSNKQIEEINYIDEKLGIKNIQNEKVRLLCILRIKFPEASYNELAIELGKELNTTISKSNINHLFRKIKEIALKLNYGNK